MVQGVHVHRFMECAVRWNKTLVSKMKYVYYALRVQPSLFTQKTAKKVHVGRVYKHTVGYLGSEHQE